MKAFIGICSSKVLMVLLVLGTPIAALAQSSSDAGPPKELLYKYIWDYVIMGDQQATDKDLRDIARFYERLPAENQTKIQKAVQSTGFSEAEKGETIKAQTRGYYSGMIVSKEGDVYEGVFLLAYNDNKNIVTCLDTSIGATSELIYFDNVAEIGAYPPAGNSGLSFKMRSGEVVSRRVVPTISNKTAFFLSGENEVAVGLDQIHRLVFARRVSVLCPQCSQVMNFDWAYCPYDGKAVTRKAKQERGYFVV